MRAILPVLRRLKRLYPHPGAMELGSPYRTLVGVVLSARTRDEQVLRVLPGLFAAYPSLETLAQATPGQIARKIDSIGMYRQKAKHLHAMAQMVLNQYGGIIPSTMEALVTLPGVGRKTASVVLAACFQTPAIAVDTHVYRVVNRLGWVRTNTPEQTERVLLTLIPKSWQTTVNRVFVKFGRAICVPSTPRCDLCPVREYCAYPHKSLQVSKHIDRIMAANAAREEQLETLRQQNYEP